MLGRELVKRDRGRRTKSIACADGSRAEQGRRLAVGLLRVEGSNTRNWRQRCIRRLACISPGSGGKSCALSADLASVCPRPEACAVGIPARWSSCRAVREGFLSHFRAGELMPCRRNGEAEILAVETTRERRSPARHARADKLTCRLSSSCSSSCAGLGSCAKPRLSPRCTLGGCLRKARRRGNMFFYRLAGEPTGTPQLTISRDTGGIDVTLRDEYGRSALHFAAFNGQFEMCQFLMHLGCEADARTQDGKSVTRCAADANKSGMIQLYPCTAPVELVHSNGSWSTRVYTHAHAHAHSCTRAHAHTKSEKLKTCFCRRGPSSLDEGSTIIWKRYILPQKGNQLFFSPFSLFKGTYQAGRKENRRGR